MHNHKDAELIHNTKSCSGHGGIVPKGIPKPKPDKWMKSKPQKPISTGGFWGTQTPR